MPANRHIPTPTRRVLAFALAVVFVAFFASAAQACPTCGAGFSEAGEAGQKMLSGWFWSIVFMMSMPFAIVASLGGYMYWIVRKARRTQTPAIEVTAIEAQPTNANERRTTLPTSVAPTSIS